MRVVGRVGMVNGVSDMHVERHGKEDRFTVRLAAVVKELLLPDPVSRQNGR